MVSEIEKAIIFKKRTTNIIHAYGKEYLSGI